jgi:catechol 2,3-dioxygenase-like lactoylglutathione lyase family enzyme
VARVNHVGITVTDLDASLAFYCEVAGFELGLRTRAAGEWFDTLTGNHGADIEIAMLRLADFSCSSCGRSSERRTRRRYALSVTNPS